MIDALKNNNKIIVNTDTDGIFCALILHKYMGCEIVGFCNSAEKVWIDVTKIGSIYDGVYIDMYVQKPDVVCIDQHIIAVDESHCQLIRELGVKFNPNLDNPRFHIPSSSYYLKYPFGTVHYIIANLEKNGIDLNLKLANIDQQTNLSFIDLLLRADDTMQTTVDSHYKSNAKEWWNWLKNHSNNGKTIIKLCDYLYSLSAQNVTEKKSATTNLLRNTYGCDSPDGGYGNICDTNGFLQEKVKKYIQFMAEISGLDMFNIDVQLISKVGVARRIALNPQQRENLKCNSSKLFSYAFVRSAERQNNFSYTVMN